MSVNDIGDGTTIAFATSTFEAYVDSIRWSGQSREMVDMSHIATTAGIAYLPSDMYDPGTLQLDLHHDPDEAIPLVGAMEVITLTFPKRAGTTAAKMVVSGAVQNYDITLAKREKISASMTVKLSGTPVFTAEVAS